METQIKTLKVTLVTTAGAKETVIHSDVIYHYADAMFYCIKEPDKFIKYKLDNIYQVTELYEDDEELLSSLP
jgi:hypothetical protein